jgi:NAD(P)-dependent dehydrogenase (short-subunit alcohol dehydrogenase family)
MGLLYSVIKPAKGSSVSLANKVVLVTGASSGIGAAIARIFAQQGARVALSARSADKLNTLAASLGPNTFAIPADMTDPAQVRRMVEATVERFGRLDILINNAGVGMYAPIASMQPEQFEQLVSTNWLGPVRAIQAAVPHMRKQGGGQIINISSVAGKVAIPWMGAYCSTKFALNALSDSLRLELARDSIRVISICPGRIATPFGANAFRHKGYRSLPPSGTSPERVAKAVLRASLGQKREIVVPASNWLFVWFHSLFPRLTDAMMLSFLRKKAMIAEEP